MNKKPRPYKKEHSTSYVGSTYPVMELLKVKPEVVEVIYDHSAFMNFWQGNTVL